ncbi:type II secretion system F family protein [Nocardioides sp. MAHUQ-72]|uniref:type II secretion system F family protein n=1 Tax=unclassified Nocardioides TaxID=2615069 RepID=UPI00360ABB43
MTARVLLRGAAAAAVLTLGLVTAPAQADPGIAVGHTETADDGSVSVLLDVDLPAGTTPDLASIDVQVDGKSVDATAESVKAGQVTRTTVLTLDASDSMRGARIAAARAAAKAFLESAPPDVRIGLLTFSDKVHDVIAPTTDRKAVASAIDGIRLTHGTHMYDAVAQAVNLAGDEGARSVLLLSDGRDTGSASSLQQAAAAAKGHDTSVDVVALDQSKQDRALVARLSSASGGDVIDAADPDALRSVFTAEADALASQLLVRFPRPEGAADDVELAVSLGAGGTTYDDSAFVSLGRVDAGGPAVVEPGRALVGKAAFLAGAAALGVGLAVILAMVLAGSRGQSESQKRIGAYLGETAPGAGAASLKDSAVALTGNFVKGDFEARLTQRLNAAGITFTAAEWILLTAGIAVASGLLGFVLGGGVLLVIALVAGAVLPLVYLKLKHSRRIAAFAAQLPETLTLMSGGLSAGLSMAQAVDTVVQEGHEPMAGELRRALVEHRLGIGLEETLEGVAERMASEDFGWVVMAIRIQREVGGNLAEILNTVADTLRERQYLRRQVRTLSAEGRLSAWMLGCLPVLMFLYMLVANREYVEPLYTQPIGISMLALAAVLLALGSWFMSRLVKVEV